MTLGPALVLSLAGAGRADVAEPAALPPAGPAATTASPSAAIAAANLPSKIAASRRIGTWQLLASSPLAVFTERGDYAPYGLWTGKEMLLLKPVAPKEESGIRMSVEGAAYNPATRTWRRLPTLHAKDDLADGDIGVAWTGSEALVTGPINGAYNPATNRWRTIATPDDFPFSPDVQAWTGRQLLVWGFEEGALATKGAAYTPSTDTWSPFPRSPFADVGHVDGVWTGKELIIVGTTANNALVAAYNPTTRSWRRLAPMPSPRHRATVTWTGKEILVVGGMLPNAERPCACALAFDPATNRWRALPDMEVGRQEHLAAWTGNQLVVWGGRTDKGTTDQEFVAPARGLVFDPARNRWSPMPKWPLRDRWHPAAVWTGTKLLIWSGVSWKTGGFVYDGAAYTP